MWRVLIVLLVFVVPSIANAEKRVALVIGNGAYTKVPTLPNPTNDAAAIADMLRKAGFHTVESKANLGVVDMRKALRDFSDDVLDADMAVVFYAGHGMEVNGINYLIPVDATIARDVDLEDEAVSLDRVIRTLQPARQLQLVILDACRDNPFVRSMRRTIANRSVRSGHGDIGEGVLPPNTLVAYAQRAGATAEDGSRANSPYTTALVKHLPTPGLDVELALRRVRDEVLRTTRNRQEPFKYGSLGGSEIPLVQHQQVTVAVPPKVEVPVPATKPAPAIVQPSSPSCDGIDTQVGNELRCLRPKDTFKDCPDCPEMVVVPAGEFVMGSNDGNADEKPAHKVTIAKPFAVGKFEVTFAEWDACVAAGGCKRKPEDRGWGRVRRPVINVSWDDAIAYMAWLSTRTGKTYRLLTEAEWEYAARAGSRGKYTWGNDIGKNRANCKGCGSKWDNRQTASVGSFTANAFGLHDMHGNAFEWVQDCYKDTYAGAPPDGRATSDVSSCRRVLRGGAFDVDTQDLRSAYRDWDRPALHVPSNGFRIARTL